MKNMNPQIYLSIVIPALNEASKIVADVTEAGEFLTANDFSGEIIVVDDGSTDTTADIAWKSRPSLPENIDLQIIQSTENRGKGHAVRRGIKVSKGKYVMFADVGCCVPYSTALIGINSIGTGDYYIMHASRHLSESTIHIHQSLYRRICSKLFRFAIRILMQLPAKTTDTQCGFKIYKGEIARKLYSNCVTDGFMFDLEVILRAQKAGYRIGEFPIKWTCDRDSRLTPHRQLSTVLAELIKIKRAVK